MVNHIFFLLSLTGFIICQTVSENWLIETSTDPVTEKESITLSKRSIGTQIFNYERKYGWLKIHSNGNKVDVYMNWGGLISIGKTYVKYKIDNHDFRGDSWTLTGEFDETIAPDPFLILLQMATSEKASLYTTPKGFPQVSYSFQLTGLKELLDEHPLFFRKYADWNSRMKDNTAIDKPPGNYTDNVARYMQQEDIFRKLCRTIESHSQYTIRPIWFIDSLREKFNLQLPEDDILVYYNRWMKDIGILITRYDIRIQDRKSKTPKVVMYREMDSISLRGNDVLGYKLMINGEKLSTIIHANLTIKNALETFLDAMSALESKKALPG